VPRLSAKREVPKAVAVFRAAREQISSDAYAKKIVSSCVFLIGREVLAEQPQADL
jgi:hypothetical protein